VSPFCPKNDIEFLTKTNNLKGINFQKVKIGSEVALRFLVSFGNHQASIHLPIVEAHSTKRRVDIQFSKNRGFFQRGYWPGHSISLRVILRDLPNLRAGIRFTPRVAGSHFLRAGFISVFEIKEKFNKKLEVF